MADKPTGILVCAILFAIGGLLSILGGLMMLLMGGAMFAGMENAGVEVSGMFAGMMGIFAVISVITGIAGLAVAYGIWNLKRWAKTVGIILAVIGLISIPIGTIMGIVILYFLLMNEETKNAFH